MLSENAGYSDLQQMVNGFLPFEALTPIGVLPYYNKGSEKRIPSLSSTKLLLWYFAN
jgi:hypothetical protein